MDLIGRGIIAGFAATLLLSAFVEPIAVLARVVGAPTLGGLLHLLLGGGVWGAGVALLRPSLPGASWFRGVVFATTSWLIIASLAAPFEGADLFRLGFGSWWATLLLHALYGAALGGIYDMLMPEGDGPQDVRGLERDPRGPGLGSALR